MPATGAVVASSMRARRDVHAPLHLAAGLTLHNGDGAYTEEARAVLQNGAALPL